MNGQKPKLRILCYLIQILLINSFIILLFLFLIIDFYFSAAIAQNFNSVAELVISIGIPIKKAKVKIYQVIVEAKIRKCSI